MTRFPVGQFGARQPIAFYIDGMEQPQRFDRPYLYPTAATTDRPPDPRDR